MARSYVDKLRQERGWNIRDFGLMAGLKSDIMARNLSDGRRPLNTHRIETLQGVAAAFGMGLEELLAGDKAYEAEKVAENAK